MKNTYRNIHEILKLNRLIVWTVVIMAFLSSCFSLWSVFDMNHKMLNSMFAVNTDGTLIPLKLTHERENFEVEARSHLQLFHNYFYGLNTSNFETNLEKALWLGDSSVDNVYRQKRAEGVYNRLLQYSLIQQIDTIQISLNSNEKFTGFRTLTTFAVSRGKSVDRYELVTTGKLLKTDRHFPRNTHGLLITEFFEESLKKLPDENR